MVRRRTTPMAATAAVATLLLGSACSGGPGGTSSSGDEVTLGVVTSQTGPASQLGVGEKRGAQLAAARINADGGVDGKKIKLVFADDQSQPAQALQQTRDLLKDNLAGIVGSSVVANCQAMSPLVEKSGPVQYCLSPGIEPKGNVFSASADTADLAKAAMSYWKKQGIERVAVVSTTDASGTNGAKATVDAAKASGITVTKAVTYDPTAVSVTSQLQQAMSSKPQALVVWATGTPVGVALKGIQQLGVDLPVMTTDGNLANAFLKRISDYTPETLLIPATRDFWWQTLDKSDAAYKLGKDYHDKYRAKYGEDPDFGPGVGYDAVLVLAEAIKKAGSTDAAKVKKAIEDIDDYDGVLGTYNFSSSNHRGLSVSSVRMVQAKDGGFTYVGQ